MKVGNKQSPIDIVQANASFDQSLKTLKFSYPSFENANFKNNGHTVVFSPNAEGNTSGNTLKYQLIWNSQAKEIHTVSFTTSKSFIK
jgi:carbonic anhydrase